MINKDKDAIGVALLDYYHHREIAMIKVKTNVALDEELDPGYFFRNYNSMPLIEQRALKLCRGKVLDVGAGAGSHSLYLQNSNTEVSAIEISPGAIEVMKQRGIKNARKINFYDLKNEKYDTILFLMNGIGLVKYIENLPSFLHHCFTLLNPSGQILFDSSDLKYLFEQEDGSFLFNLNDKYYGEVIYNISYKEINSEPFHWLYVDKENLMAICDELNYNFEIIMEDSHYQYLARITK